MKILYLDIETTPIVADVWALYNQNVAINQIKEPTRMLCYAYKWHGEPTEFRAEWDYQGGWRHYFIGDIWTKLEAADVVVTWNGDHFDLPHLNREFVETGFQPPAPYKSVDLFKQVKKKFRFPSNKLQYVTTALGLRGKVQHTGHQLWIDAIAGDAKARALMKEYNIGDVDLLEELGDRLQTWVDMPNINLFNDDLDGCPRCGAAQLYKEGFAYTANGKYQRYRCSSCGKWSRSSRREQGVTIQEIK